MFAFAFIFFMKMSFSYLARERGRGASTEETIKPHQLISHVTCRDKNIGVSFPFFHRFLGDINIFYIQVSTKWMKSIANYLLERRTITHSSVVRKRF